MLYYIIAVFVFLIIVTALFIPKSRPAKRDMKRLEPDDFLRGARNLARENKIIERGKSFSIMPLLRTFLKAERLITFKMLSNRPVTEGEKWLYENLYYVKRFADAFNEKSFALLPRSRGGLRMMSIARYIIDNSQGVLDFERIKKAIDTVNNETVLTFAEIMSLRDALSAAISEGIYILAKRIIHFNKMEKAAKKGFNSNKLQSDIYLHFLLASDKRPQVLEALTKRGINIEGVEFNYSMSVVETSRMAKYLFDTIKNLPDILSNDKAISLLLIDKELSLKGAYADMSYETKMLYLNKISAVSDIINANELFVTKKLVNFSAFNKLDPVIVLYEHTASLIKYIKNSFYLKKVKPKSGRGKELFYALSVTFLSLLFSVGMYFASGNILAAALFTVPAFILTECLVNTVLSSIIRPRPLPEMSYSDIPAEHSAIIVVSEFITSHEQMKEAVEHLKMIKETNEDKNISACLLVDLKASDSEEHEGDAAILEAAKTLEGREGYAVLIRKRKKLHKRYQAYERKRGAIMALVKMLMTGNSSDFLYMSDKNIARPQYIIALDADNTLNIGGAKEMINIIAHPANARYDLIAARSRYNLYSLKTPYACRFRVEGNYVNYPNYSSLFYNLFGRDIFCGKGIFRLKSFYAKLEGIFPDNRILSHDIIEGAVLDTASGAVIYEEAPKNFVADRERRKRWARGDIQLLPFTGKFWKTNEGEIYRSEVRPIYKFLIVRNFINIVMPVFVLALGIVSLFVKNTYILFLIALFLPFVLDVIGLLRRAFRERMRPRYVLKDILLSFYNAVTEAGLLPYYAYCNFILVVTTLKRMLFKGNLLEWKTYYHSQTGSGKFVNETAPSMLIAPVAAVFAYFFGGNLFSVIVFAVISYIIYLCVYLSGKPVKEKCTGSENLMSYAAKTYAYFKYMRKKNHLIADNLQIKPYKGMSETTSPTNIGFQMLSELSAFLLGFIKEEELTETLDEIVSQAESLEKWRGNLYNWYKVKDCSVAMPFVSSVDSGNFLAALLIVYGYLLGEENITLSERVKKLIDSTEIEAMYDGDKKQFYLGYNTKTGKAEGHYDLLASESRLLSLLYIARSGDIAHWKALIRDFTPIYGNTLFSWSGTMFEYLMPEIFMKSAEGSLCDRSAKNAVRAQRKNRIRGVFGLSESGYYAFDDGMRYQYKAFGIDALALGREKQKNVISPYSTFLAVEYDNKRCIENLKNLENAGVLGDYGFYEAVDMEGRTRIVRSYMTHHQGMVMTAICNCLTGGKLRKYMLKNPRMAGVSILLTEEIPKNIFTPKYAAKEIISPANEEKYYINIANIEYSTAGAGLTDGTISAYFDAAGGGYTLYGGYLLNRFIKGPEEGGARYFYVSDGKGGYVSPTYTAKKDSYDKYSFSYSAKSVTYINGEDGVKLDVGLDGNLCAEIDKLTVNGGQGKTVCFYEPLALNTYAAQNAHPAFSNMFVTTEFSEEHNALIASRRLRKGERPVYAALIARGLVNVKWESDRFHFIGRLKNETEPRFLAVENAASPSFGDVLEPCFALKGELIGDTAEIIKVFADSYDALVHKLRNIPEDYYGFAVETGNIIPLSKLAVSLLYPMTSLPYPNRTLAETDALGARDELMRECSGGKLLVFTIDDGNELSYFKQFIAAVSELRFFEIYPPCAVVIPENAEKGTENAIRRILKEYFVYNCRIVNAPAPDSLYSSAFLILDKSFTFPVRTFFLRQEHFENPPKREQEDIQCVLKSGSGCFKESGVYSLAIQKSCGLPYSNVIAGTKGGFIATENGGGVIFFENSHENRVLRFDNDPVKDTPYETISVETDNKRYRVNGGQGVTYRFDVQKGLVRYESAFSNYKTILESYLTDDGAVKINELILSGKGNISLIYTFKAMLGAEFHSPFIYSEKIDAETVKIKNLLTYREAFIKIFSPRHVNIEWFTVNGDIKFILPMTANEIDKIYIAVGLYEEIKALSYENIGVKKAQMLAYFEGLNRIKIVTSDKALDIMFNDWLLYQTVSARLNGKCGYYQLGGATGFRDQLQDCLALLQNDPKRVRTQILYHAARQYKEGDVMHWWHHPKTGLRSRISDDKLYLPYLTAEYVAVTGDKSILEEKIPYLDSQTLAEREHARYECPLATYECAALHEHCLAAIKSSLKFGEHNLMLLGTGDWNDGLDYVGSKGRGESVVLTMFAYEVITKYAAVCGGEVKDDLNGVAARLKTAVETHAYDGKQYMRLYGDDGKWYGARTCSDLSIDLVSQSYAVLSGIAEGERAASALNEAGRLVDSDNGIIKLLAPPLDTYPYLGYISAYPKGVRENGGQYTHASIWYITALLREGKAEEAYALFDMINPASRLRSRERNLVYKGEPYVMPADVYAGQNAGRMGWSWYTGSASWTYKLILEEFFGVKRRGGLLYIEPILPAILSGSEMDYSSEYGIVRIKFIKKGAYKLIADGLALHNKKFIRLDDKISSVVLEF